MKTIAVIPARYASTRFPGKPLAKILHKPMLQHVYERVLQVPSLDEVWIATDDDRIEKSALDFGAKVVRTSSEHQTGTDRIVEAVAKTDCDWVLNVQGDEPLICIEDLEELLQQTQKKQIQSMSTLIYWIEDESVAKNPNVAKVAINQQFEALFFSRSLIPFPRSGFHGFWKHQGVYLYRKAFLMQFHQWPQAPMEKQEQLEQLRALENGHVIFCVEAQEDSIGVDTPEDLIKAEQRILAHNSDK